MKLLIALVITFVLPLFAPTLANATSNDICNVEQGAPYNIDIVEYWNDNVTTPKITASTPKIAWVSLAGGNPVTIQILASPAADQIKAIESGGTHRSKAYLGETEVTLYHYIYRSDTEYENLSAYNPSTYGFNFAAVACWLQQTSFAYNEDWPATTAIPNYGGDPEPTESPSSSPTPTPSTNPVSSDVLLNLNPVLMSDKQLESATASQILAGIYRVLVSAYSVSLALVVFYFVYKIIVWLSPKFWSRQRQDKENSQ